jgi:hypothetical protein
MILFTLGFEPHSFEKTTLEQMKTDVRSRLAGHDFARLSVTLLRDFRREIVMQFRGDAEEVAIAKRILGVY